MNSLVELPAPTYTPELELQWCAFEASLRSYLPEERVQDLQRAFHLGARAHVGQTRKSGEPYITHPLAVSQILADMRMDHETLIAALLHDTIEDTPLDKADVTAEFGLDVAELVDGVTKLDRVEFESRQEATAESFRKMIMAMARDLRVILIKLCDRLHNMRTLDAMKPDSRRRIARETLEIYAPIAQRLGMNAMRLELQDLGFAALYPMRHRVLSKCLNKNAEAKRELIAKVQQELELHLRRDGLSGTVQGRLKTAYSTYMKMRAQHKDFDQILDLIGFRVITPRVSNCYQALGVAHALYMPKPGQFKDYIAIPKPNGYQSLHTVLFGPGAVPIEIQIRTEDMDKVAERGIAAHWVYKTNGDGGNSAQHRAREWLGRLVDAQRQAGSSLEFLDNLKVDLFPDEVYLFTPRGEIMALPRNATVVDFAYAVHTDVGDHTVAARVDKQLAPLRTRLRSGQSVEVITARSARPNAQWLEFVVTAKARTAIRHHLRKLQHEEAVQIGHRLLDQALEALGASLDTVPAEALEQVLKDFPSRRLEELLADIALGNRMASLVANRLVREPGEQVAEPSQASSEALVQLSGQEGSIVSYANCCHPIPGDEVFGYLSPGKGIVVHRNQCPNGAQFRRTPERCLVVHWADAVRGDFKVELRVEVFNRQGALATVAAAISDAASNIANVEHLARDDQHSTLLFLVEVSDRQHLARVMRRIRAAPPVQTVARH